MGIFNFWKRRTETKATDFTFPRCPKCSSKARPATVFERIKLGTIPNSITWHCSNCITTFANPIEPGQKEEYLAYMKAQQEKDIKNTEEE